MSTSQYIGYTDIIARLGSDSYALLFLCVTADGLELLKDSVQLALAYYISRMSSGVVAGSSRLVRISLIPAALRAIPASFVKTLFFGSSVGDHVMFSESLTRMRHSAVTSQDFGGSSCNSR